MLELPYTATHEPHGATHLGGDGQPVVTAVVITCPLCRRRRPLASEAWGELRGCRVGCAGCGVTSQLPQQAESDRTPE